MKKGICRGCGEAVVRYPGRRYVDGSQETEAHPIWLTASSAEEHPGPDEVVPDVDCGCVERAMALELAAGEAEEERQRRERQP